MILRPVASSHHDLTPADAASAAPIPAVPAWLRRAVPDAQSLAGHSVEDLAITAGAAIGALDVVVRRQEKWASAWRQRRALAAAAVTARQVGRIEAEAALRDAVLLTRLGDAVGPAGRMLLAWRRLAATPADKLLTAAGIGAALDDLGLARNDEGASDLADELRQLAGSGMVEMLRAALEAADRHGFGRAIGAFIADMLLAQRLGWAYAVPLLGTEAALAAGAARRRRDIAAGVAHAEPQTDRAKSLLATQARAVLRAIDLSVELGRRAEKLLAVAPKLRAKGANTVMQKLLSGDAMVASDPVAGINDRGLRRLFDRLVELGAVRELSGRATFRIYGL